MSEHEKTHKQPAVGWAYVFRELAEAVAVNRALPRAARDVAVPDGMMNLAVSIGAFADSARPLCC